MESSRDEGEESNKGESESAFSELLNFASRAQALISELLLLAGRIPPEFRDRRNDSVLFDLRYFDTPGDFESKIEGNANMEMLEDQLRESCAVFMQRFFLLASGVVIYYQDLLEYLNVLQEGTYLQSSLQRVMENEKGLQLLTESLALFGCLLLLLEHHISGSLREKLLVAHVRHDRCFDAPNLEAICLLCRTHQSSSGSHCQIHSFPAGSVMISIQKPEDLFMRFPFPNQVVDSVVSRLRDCDLYDKVRHYPEPEHRTVALASQAGLLYVLLFYSPKLLHNVFVMREIVDRFFKDSWVVPIFMYFTVDILLSWDPYEAAKASLSSSLSPVFIRDICQLHCTKVKSLRFEICSLLSDGALTGDYLLNNSKSLISLVTNCNVSLRWLLLHIYSNNKKLRDIITSSGIAHQIDEESLLLLLLKTSQFEFEVRQQFVKLLEDKGTLFEERKRHASENILELSKYCSGSQALSLMVKDECLEDCFKNLSLEVFSLDYTKIGISGRKLYHMISKLKELEQLHEIKDDMKIKLHLFGIQKDLQHMLQTLNLQDDDLSTFIMVTDAVYAWGFVGNFTDKLLKNIEQDASIVLNLHSFFLKFQTVLDTPILRIAQNHSSDLPFVSAYYSSEFKTRIFETLEIVRVMLFKILNDDIARSLQPFNLPNRVERDNLEVFLQPDQHFHLMKAFHQTSTFSQGIMVMHKTLLSLIDLDVKNWIEGKMHEEIFKRLDTKLRHFFLTSNVGLEELEINVQKSMTYILSQLHIMECFQDLVHINGSKIWGEEFTKFLKDCAQKECDDYASRRKQDSIFMQFQVNEFSNARTFLGHLLHQILQLTKTSQSIYIEPMSGWFDTEGHELLGIRFFDLLESCVGPVGMDSLDSILASIIKERLENALRGLKTLMNARCLDIETVDAALGSPTSLPLLGWSSYKQMAKFVDASWDPWVESLAFIGQLQLLRCLIALELKSACKVKAGLIYSAVDGVIAALSTQRGERQKGTKMGCGEETDYVLHELSKQGHFCGFSSPLSNLYISENPPAFLSRCLSIVTIAKLPHYVLDSRLGTLTSQPKMAPIDFAPVVIGLGTFLRQFHPTYLFQYVQYMGQHIRITAETAFGLDKPQKGSTDPTLEVQKSAFWMMYFCKHMGIPRDLVESCVPPSLLAVIQT